MQKKSFILFHLNLGFSSIPKKDFKKVIKQCYWSIESLIEKSIPVCIESSGRTLELIKEQDPSFLKFLKNNIRDKKIEFIGSGYVQMIQPLSPHHINQLNQLEGRKVYKKILAISPKTALVNEMVFSKSMIELYKSSGYQTIIIDLDNASKALGIQKSNLYHKSYLQDDYGNTIQVAWSDSRLFQSFQRYIHGDISYERYKTRLSKHLKASPPYTPIYTNDAEVFNYRPGRFNTESESREDEWKKIVELALRLQFEQFKFYFLEELFCLKNVQNSDNLVIYNPKFSHLVSVKKQSKYNISRWSVTGKVDQLLNTQCYELSLDSNYKKYNIARKRELLRLWGSDLRTHIVPSKLKEELKLLSKFSVGKSLTAENQKLLKPSIGKLSKISQTPFTISDHHLFYDGQDIHASIILNKGLAIKGLRFLNQKEAIISYDNDFFDDIDYGSDFFSGSTLIEVPSEKSRYTDYKYPEKIAFYQDGISYSIKSVIDLNIAKLTKVLSFENNQNISFKYYFQSAKKIDSIIRLGNLIFRRHSRDNFRVSSTLGGIRKESNLLTDTFDHSKRTSIIVSSSSGMPATDGEIFISSNDYAIKISLDHSKSFCLPMILNEKVGNKYFTRLIFSLSEVDDNSLPKRIPKYFEFRISKLSE